MDIPDWWHCPVCVALPREPTRRCAEHSKRAATRPSVSVAEVEKYAREHDAKRRVRP